MVKDILKLKYVLSGNKKQARREGGGCDGCARTPPQTAEVHFFVKKINSKKNKSVVLFVLF